MIKITAVSTLKPGALQDYLKEVRELIEKSNQEPGCISYQLYQDKNNPDKVAMFEEWKDDAAIEAHNASEHFTTICPRLSKYCIGESAVDFYQEI